MKDDFKKLLIKCNILNQQFINNVLWLINKEVPANSFPFDYQTLMATPQGISLIEMGNGEYYHFVL